MNITLHKVGCHAPYEPYLRSPPSSSARLRTPNDERYLGWGYLLSAPLLTSFSLMLAPLTRVSGNGRSSSSLSDTKNGSDFDIFEQQIVFGTKFLACGRGISFSKVRIVRESPSSSFPFSSSFDDESSPSPSRSRLNIKSMERIERHVCRVGDTRGMKSPPTRRSWNRIPGDVWRQKWFPTALHEERCWTRCEWLATWTNFLTEKGTLARRRLTSITVYRVSVCVSIIA